MGNWQHRSLKGPDDNQNTLSPKNMKSDIIHQSRYRQRQNHF